MGIYASGQAYESMLIRMRSHPLPEAQQYAALMLEELRKVIPSFLRRVDLSDRGGRWSEYLTSTRTETSELVRELFSETPTDHSAPVVLTDWDPDGENKLVAAICYSYSSLPESQILREVDKMSHSEKVAILKSYIGQRENRRHRPGRAFERIDYRFDVLSDYGAFRDLQRHRLLTIEWQPLTPNHGYTRPDLVDEAGMGSVFDDAMGRSAALFDDMSQDFPEQASYAVSMAYRIRYVMQFNAREAMHMLELRSSPQGHPAYRRVALDMHRLIAEQAGHRAVAEAMTHLTVEAPELERLAAERRAEERRSGRG